MAKPNKLDSLDFSSSFSSPGKDALNYYSNKNENENSDFHSPDVNINIQ